MKELLTNIALIFLKYLKIKVSFGTTLCMGLMTRVDD